MIPGLYCHNWREVATAIKQACGWQCQVCGKQCQRPGELPLGWQYTLTVAHWNQHDYDAPTAFVVACCVPCHFRHDAPFVWHARRRAERYRQRLAGQLTLFAARG